LSHLSELLKNEGQMRTFAEELSEVYGPLHLESETWRLDTLALVAAYVNTSLSIKKMLIKFVQLYCNNDRISDDG
jgi:hypothetical protein